MALVGTEVAGNWAALRREFDDEVTVAPEYDPRFLRRVAGPDYQSFWVCTYGGNMLAFHLATRPIPDRSSVDTQS